MPCLWRHSQVSLVNADKKQKFLRLICDYYLEGRAQELNEHLLGYDVFGRDSSYNPSNDPIVRVFAHEICKKLEAYYGNEGPMTCFSLIILSCPVRTIKLLLHLPHRD